MREGKNREISNVLRALGLQVNRLIRVSFGPFQLGELPDGAVEEVKTRTLRDQLGPRLAAHGRGGFFVGDRGAGGAARSNLSPSPRGARPRWRPSLEGRRPEAAQRASGSARGPSILPTSARFASYGGLGRAEARKREGGRGPATPATSG